jgi:HlyD family secretion protein/adhesin transport system membrane fusion protein
MSSRLPYKPAINPLMMIFGSLFLVIIPFVTWASFAEIDQISHAQGSVIATAKTQEIQSSIDGVIEKVTVKEGDSVKKGDIIVMLDKSQNKVAHEASFSKVASLDATLSRLKAEVYGKALEFSPRVEKNFPDFIESQRELYRLRKLALNDEISSLQDSVRLSQNELNMNMPLVASGDIGKVEVIKLQRQITDLKGQILNKKNKYFQDAQTEMTKVEEELSTREQELADKNITLEKSTINSPMNAIVKNILITTEGARVRPGDLILELVPVGDELIIEAKLQPSDISFIHKGQLAAIKLDAYDYSIYGIFHGTVKYISPDSIIEKTPQGDKPYFRVQIAIDKKSLKSKTDKKIEISTGMTAQIDIITGRRTVLDYLSKPVMKTFGQAFHER